MKLSVIVPVYNAEKYLDKCLTQLMKQQVSGYEVILINDGSKDNSLEILKKWKNDYPDKIVILDVDNGGQGRARNFALDIARGEYIGFADSDDWVDDLMFSKLLSAAEREDADIAVCDSWCVDEHGGKRYEHARPQGTALSAAGSIWNKIVRRSLVGKIRFPEGVWYEDFSFSAKLLMSTDKIVFLEEALYYYRSGHPSTMRNQNSAKNLDMITVMEDIRASLSTGHEEDFRFLVINHMLLDSIKRVSYHETQDKKKVIKQFREYVHKYVPSLLQCESFKKEKRNRKIIMLLNYYGLEDVSRLLLELKK